MQNEVDALQVAVEEELRALAVVAVGVVDGLDEDRLLGRDARQRGRVGADDVIDLDQVLIGVAPDFVDEVDLAEGGGETRRELSRGTRLRLVERGGDGAEARSTS